MKTLLKLISLDKREIIESVFKTITNIFASSKYDFENDEILPIVEFLSSYTPNEQSTQVTLLYSKLITIGFSKLYSNESKDEYIEKVFSKLMKHYS
jgi:hypothetical protein